MNRNYIFLGIYIIVLSSFSFLTTEPINYDITKQIINSHTEYILYKSIDPALQIHVVKMNQDFVDMCAIPAQGQREEVLSIAKRSNALIAINGANYRRGGRFNGNRLNFFKIKNDIYCDLQFERGSLCWTGRKSYIDIIQNLISFKIENRIFCVDRINQPRKQNESIIYNKFASKDLILFNRGNEIIIKDNKIVGFNNIIDDYDYIYQTDKDFQNVEIGMNVSLNFEIKSNGGMNWNNMNFILSGAGLLINDGKILTETDIKEEFNQGFSIFHSNDEIAADFHHLEYQDIFINGKHPRTAVAIDENNFLFFIVVDGRQKCSQGFTLAELSQFISNLGCNYALNIGGGGCSTLYLDGKIINSLVNNEERPVSEALCIWLK